MMGHELRCRRLALGLNQDDLADVLGTKQVKVSRWERGTVALWEALGTGRGTRGRPDNS